MQHGTATGTEVCFSGKKAHDERANCPEPAVVEQTTEPPRQSVSAVAAAEVKSILGKKPVSMVCRKVRQDAAQAYAEKIVWYFDQEQHLVGGTAVFTFADGRVESLWWDKQGNRPKVFDYFKSPPCFLPC